MSINACCSGSSLVTKRRHWFEFAAAPTTTPTGNARIRHGGARFHHASAHASAHCRAPAPVTIRHRGPGPPASCNARIRSGLIVRTGCHREPDPRARRSARPRDAGRRRFRRSSASLPAPRARRQRRRQPIHLGTAHKGSEARLRSVAAAAITAVRFPRWHRSAP